MINDVFWSIGPGGRGANQFAIDVDLVRYGHRLAIFTSG